jgi:membrane associated rhomboid family serine protease
LIPIRDTIPRQTTPYVVYSLIGLNVWAFFKVNLGLPPGYLQSFFHVYGMVPARYSDPAIARALAGNPYLPFLTSMFLHGGLMHLLGNMWSLWIFGDNVEDWLGHGRFALFYLFCGVVSGLMHLFTNWGSELPTIGASGAIAGVMGAYFLLYPKARVVTLIPIFIFIQFVELPAYIFLGFWFLMQFLSGTASLGAGSAGGIAWWAHIGGFLAGAAVVFVLGGAKPQRPSRTRATMKPMWQKVDDYWRN